MKKIILGIIIVVLIILFATQSGKKEDGEVVIGGLFGLTGFVSFTGEASRDGFLMAIEDSGMDVKYVIEDFESDSVKAVTAAKKLINVDKADIVVGPEWNEFGTAITPVADSEKVAFISPWGTSELEWTESPYYMSVTPSERKQREAQVAYMEKQGVKKVVLVFTNNAWALENAAIMEDVLSGTSIEVVGKFEFGATQLDMRTDLQEVKGLEPDAVYAAISSGDQVGPFHKQYVELGLDSIPLYVPESTLQDAAILTDFGPYIEGVIHTATKEYARKQEFDTKFEKRYGHLPATRSAATAYDAATLILNAIRDGAQNGEEIREHLMNVKGYKGYSSIIEFDQFGRVFEEDVELRQIKNGESVLIN